MIINHVDDSDSSCFFGKLSNNIIDIFPPLNLTLRNNMQILTLRTVKLSLAILDIYFDSGLATDTIEPICDISTGILNEWSGKLVFNVLLDDSRQVVYFSKENDPAIIGSIVIAYFLESIVSLFL